jgi:DNA (cytosine-5)-methyltransferase 1
MLRAIREIQPRWIVGENVLGLVNWNGGMVFEEVQADLEAEGYEVQPYVLPAAAVGSCPHRRDRVWFVAYSINCGHSTGRKKESGQDSLQGISREAMDTGEFNGTSVSSTVAHSNSNGFNKCDSEHEINTSEGGFNALSNADTGNEYGDAADTGKVRLSSQKPIGELGRKQRFTISNEPDTWEKFPTQSPICSRNDGFSNRLHSITFSKWRNESIKAAGNAVVPQLILQIFKAIHIFETQNLKP